LWSIIFWRASAVEAAGPSVTGSTMIPFSLRLTFSTSRAWAAGGMFLWMIPIPPSCASAIARAASVTVSIGADTSGMCRRMLLVRLVAVSTSRGTTAERAGISRTSSKVMPSAMILSMAVLLEGDGNRVGSFDLTTIGCHEEVTSFPPASQPENPSGQARGTSHGGGGREGRNTGLPEQRGGCLQEGHL